MRYIIQRTLTENYWVDAESAQTAITQAMNDPDYEWEIIDGPEYRIFDSATGERVDDWEYPE